MAEKKKAFSIADYVKPEDVSNLDRVEIDKIVGIPIGDIAENEKNFYDTSNVTELVNSIALNGLLEPILVMPVEGERKYRIISGHRRFKAFSQLHEESPEKYAEIPAIIKSPKNEVVEELMLIEANSATRVMSSADTARQAERYKELLANLKESGVEIPGRLRDVVAEAMQISASRLARLDVIRKGLIPDIQADWETGKLNESTAYELAKLIPAHQDQLFRNVRLSDFSSHLIPRLAEKLNMYFGPGLKCSRNLDPRTQTPNYCKHGESMWAVSKKRSVWDMCQGCCANCFKKDTCKSVCPLVAPEIEEAKTKKAEALKTEKEDRERRKIARHTYLKDVWARIRALRAASTVSFSDIKSALEATEAKTGCGSVWWWDEGDLDELEKSLDDDSPDIDLDEDILDGITLYALANLFGCSVDYLLGRTEQKNKRG